MCSRGKVPYPKYTPSHVKVSSPSTKVSQSVALIKSICQSDLGHEGFSRLCHGSQSSPVISSGQATFDFCSCIAIVCHHRHIATVFAYGARITLGQKVKPGFRDVFVLN